LLLGAGVSLLVFDRLRFADNEPAADGHRGQSDVEALAVLVSPRGADKEALSG
jgi:hypothetical protein